MKLTATIRTYHDGERPSPVAVSDAILRLGWRVRDLDHVTEIGEGIVELEHGMTAAVEIRES